MPAPRRCLARSSSATMMAMFSAFHPNLENPDEECDLDYTPNVAKEMKVGVAVNNSFGFGGHNATLVAAEFTG